MQPSTLLRLTKFSEFGRLSVKTCRTAIALLAGALLASSAFGQSPPFQDLHDFGGTVTLSNGSSGADGNGPCAVAIDKLGNKFVTAQEGGLYNQGGIFEVTAGGKYVDLHDFDGATNPFGFAVDGNGNFPKPSPFC